MGITLHTTGYGRDATATLHARIALLKATDPLRPVTVVVPANSVGVAVRRALASGELGPLGPGDGIIGLTLVTVWRLAELLGAPALAAQGRRPVSTPVVAAAVRHVLHDEPGLFRAVAEHPSTEESLVRVHRELSDCSPDALDTLAGLPGPRAADVVRVHRAVRQRLADRWYDEADLMASARTAVEGGSSVLDDLGAVLVHLPQVLSLGAASLLRTLATATDVEVIAGLTGVPAADHDVHRSLGRLGLSVPSDAPQPTPPVATRTISVSDAEEEVRSAVDEILAAARSGVPMERIAVLYPSPEPYARLLHEQLGAAEIAVNGPSVQPLADRLAGRWLLDVLHLPDRAYARPAVMDVLLGAPVRGGNGSRLPASAWERLSREAGVVRGRTDWQQKLARLATELRAQADTLEQEEDPRDWLIDRSRRQADGADRLREFVGSLFAALDAIAGADTWSEIADRCQQLLTHFLGDEQHRGRRWPEVEAEAAQKVEAALDRLRGLDELEAATSLAAFRRTLEMELDADLDRVGRLGQGVLVGTPTSALGVELDVVIVLGMAEGVFPSRPREDSLLADRERETVRDELPPRSDRVHVEHRAFLAALASSRTERILIHPRGDLRRSLERAPSRWLLDTCQALAGSRAWPPDEAVPLQHVASLAGRLASVAFPATDQQWRLRSLEDHRRSGAEAGTHPLAQDDPAFAAGVRMIDARRGPDFSRYEGNLASVVETLPRVLADDHTWSASRLEAWVSCPHAYLAAYVLRIDPLENPEELLTISPLDLGNLVHEVLDHWLAASIREGEVPDPSQPWPAEARAALLELGEAACDDAEARGLTGHPLLWRRDRQRILADLARFLDEDDARRRAQGLTPVATELDFGVGNDRVLRLALGDGRWIAVRGKVDRVDRTVQGGLVVTDYKTGRRYAPSTFDDDPVLSGTKLQLPLYAEAARRWRGDPDATVHASYWFVNSEKGDFAELGYEVTDEVAERLREVLRTLVDGLSAGHFPQRPEPPGFRVHIACCYCDPDGLGTSDRFRHWERLRRHDDLRTYVAMVEPDAVADLGAPAPGAEQLTLDQT